jgi:deoxyribodipyrimidine photolyase-related protein
VRSLLFILGDQLDARAAGFDDAEPARDCVLMAEVRAEATRVWSSKPRTAFFLAAMRQFAERLRSTGFSVDYHRITEADGPASLGDALERAVVRLRPERIVVTHPGEYGVLAELRAAAARAGVPLDVREDRHFLCSPGEFAAHAAGRRQLRLEYFYREMRRRTGVLMDGDDPAGGAFNFDAENRKAFGREGPGRIDPPRGFTPDAITRSAIDDVRRTFPEAPGSLEAFDWPVTRADALAALDGFIADHLPRFGDHQDAMWAGEPWLHHSRLAAALNVKLLDPREVIAAAEDAYRRGAAPLASAEGFIRQILGWREYVRGIYWQRMPQYAELNALEADRPLPRFYWTGETDMRCLAQAIGQTLALGYAHHIQRLMVTGLFALLLGVRPRHVHEWYLAVYVDAVEWVELPNTIGMSQYADGGLMASKPYVASGRYIERMSNYCAGCRFDPGQRTGPAACPFTTLYWDFLIRHDERLAGNRRLDMQRRNAARLDAAERAAIQAAADDVRRRVGA